MLENTHGQAMDNFRTCPDASQPEDGWQPPQSERASEDPNDQVEIIDSSKRKSSNDSQEYYMLIMMPIAPKSWVVAKHHGWWDDDEQQPKLTTMLLNTTNEPLTESEAIQLYIEQRSYLLNQGFVYIVGPSGEPVAAS
jgi:hypothetical protein